MSVHNIRDMMINNKDPTEKKDKIGVYEIPIEVEEGKNMVYVGSTVRRHEERFIEHKRDIQKGKQTTALAKYCKENMKDPQWENVKTYSYHTKTNEIRTHETMQIYARREKRE